MATSTKPYQARASELKPGWHVLDAEGKTLGRLSSEIAVLLQGKHKSTYVPYLNTGDYVVVINAGKIHVTGNKLKQKVYYRYSGYHGGLKEETLAQVLQKSPTRAIKHAVKGMLPKNTLGRKMLSRLKLNAGNTHPHEAQVRGSQKAQQAEDATPAASPASSPEETSSPASPRGRSQRTQTKGATSTAKPTRAGRSTQAKGATSTAKPTRAGQSTQAKGATSTAKPTRAGQSTQAKGATSTAKPARAGQSTQAKGATSTAKPTRARRSTQARGTPSTTSRRRATRRTEES